MRPFRATRLRNRHRNDSSELGLLSQIGVPAIMTMLAERGIQPSAGMMSRTMGIQMCGDVLGNYVVSHQLRPL